MLNFRIIVNLRSQIWGGTIFLIWDQLYYYVGNFTLFDHPPLWNCLIPSDTLDRSEERV